MKSRDGSVGAGERKAYRTKCSDQANDDRVPRIVRDNLSWDNLTVGLTRVRSIVAAARQNEAEVMRPLTLQEV